MIKHNFSKLVIGISSALLACASISVSYADVAPVTLRASSTFGDGHVIWPHADAWMKEVAKNSDNNIKFQTFTWGELISAGQDYDGIMAGRADLSLVMLPAYERDRFPLSEVTLLPLTNSSLEIAMAAFVDLMNSEVPLKDGKSYYQLEWENSGMKALPVIITPEYRISTVTGPDSLEDESKIKKLRLRTAAQTHDIYAKLIGANTISMPGGDMYDALSRGALDGNVISVADWSTYGFEEMFKATLDGVSLGHYPGVIGFSQKRWDDLGPEAQEILEKAAYDTIDVAIDVVNERTRRNLKENKKNGGVEVSVKDMDENLQKLYQDSVATTWIEWIDSMEADGKPGKNIAILWRDLIKQHGGEVPDAVNKL